MGCSDRDIVSDCGARRSGKKEGSIVNGMEKGEEEDDLSRGLGFGECAGALP